MRSLRFDARTVGKALSGGTGLLANSIAGSSLMPHVARVLTNGIDFRRALIDSTKVTINRARKILGL